MKHILVSLLLLLTCTLAGAQQLRLSPSDLDDLSFDHIRVIGQDEDGYYLLLSNLSLLVNTDRVGFKNRKYKIAYFNKSLVQKWSKPVTPAVEDADIDAVTFFNNSVLIVTSKFNSREGKISYYLGTVDNEGNFSGGDIEKTFFTPVRSEYEKSEVIISSNRELFAIVTREYTGDDQQQAFVAVMNTSLNEVEKKSKVIPYPEKTFDFGRFALSDKGDFLILGVNSEKVKALSSKRKTDYLLYTSPAGNPGFVERKIPQDKMITGAIVTYDNINDKAVLAGFYAEKDSYIGAGIFYTMLDLNSTGDIKLKTSAIDGQKNVRLKGERNTGAGYSITGYPIERIVLRNDGGAVLVAEASYTTEYSYYDYFTQSFSYRQEYHFDNVVILSINKDATVDWSVVIDKNQVSLDDGGVFSSFSPLLNSEQFMLLYNDDISRHNSIIPVTVSNTGNMTRGKKITAADGLLLLPRSGKQVAENELLVPVYRKRKLYLALFTF